MRARAAAAEATGTEINLLVVLQTTALVRADGDDVDTFLQGQLSSDLRKLTKDRTQLAAYSSPKGRVLAVLNLSRTADGAVLLEIDHDLAESVVERLRRFILRARVRLEPLAGWMGLGLAGAQAAGILSELGLPAPAEAGAVAWSGDVRVTRRNGGRLRFTVWGRADRMAEIQARVQRHLPLRDITDWRRMELLEGLPHVYRQTQDHFVAQMLNLDLLGGISFDKGCYTGQEVIARLHYLGNLKRRMFRLQAAVRDIAPGTAVIDPAGNVVGEVVDAANVDHGSVVSAVLQLGHLDAPLRLQGHEPGALSKPQIFAPSLPPLPDTSPAPSAEDREGS